MPELALNPETDSSETSEDTRTPLEQVSEVLRGEDKTGDQVDDQAATDEDSQAEASSETDNDGTPTNLDGLAKRLGVEVADLYDVEIPFDNEGVVEHKTLGEIKDAFKASGSIEVDRLAWEELKAGQEQELMRNMADLQEVIQMLPKSAIGEDLIRTVTTRRAELVKREQRLTQAMIPSWLDDMVADADKTEMRDYLSRYGFGEAYLDNVVDHKTLAFIRDATKRALRIEKALDQVSTRKKTGHKSSARPAKKPAKKPTSRRRNSQSQVDEIVELLNTG